MANTYQAIASQVLSSSASSITFSSIPGTYTDLVLKASVRSAYASRSSNPLIITFNGLTTTIYSDTDLYANGLTASSARESAQTSFSASSNYAAFDAGTSATSTFSPVELYIPNYTASANKPNLITWNTENNSSTAFGLGMSAGLFSSTSAITSITLADFYSPGFATGSRFDLYGITHF